MNKAYSLEAIPKKCYISEIMMKIAVIGIGGRTGAMFASELKKVSNILGFGREKEIGLIREGKFFIEKRGGNPEIFQAEVFEESQFLEKDSPDIIFLTTKNPVGPVIKSYYQKIREKGYTPPTLILSQNGIACSKDATNALKEIFGEEYKKIRLVRAILFNPIERKETEGKIYINYSLPIKISFGKISGPNGLEDITTLFKGAGFEVREFPSEDLRNIEFSKLFLNLIGMASATRGLSVGEGFKNYEIFKEEIIALREYIKVVLASGGSFVNFPKYPVELLATLFNFIPVIFLSLFKNYLGKFISKERKNKPKDLDEIEYYNGAVVQLAENLKIPVPINKQIQQRAERRGA